ncbi:MAG: cyclic beta 1-2 glucan synthetase [Burkholderiaceae bacterium]|nr:cyclic beta 1-2 glucan synthetase [Burkholderiaceae bacterium]
MKSPRRTSLWHLPAWAPWVTTIRSAAIDSDEPSETAEIYTADQMAQHGLRLARQHKLAAGRGRNDLLQRLENNESILVSVWQQLCATVAESRRTTPAGEWLLDNFYLIEEQIRIARQHLPASYNRELPRLLEGASAGLPRVYDLAIESISRADGRVDMDSLRRFVESYQTVQPLRLGELWAIPIMLRLALIEKLAGAALRIERGHRERALADRWADTMIATAERDPKNVIIVVADMARSDPPLGSAFVAELVRRLQGRSPSLALPLTWVEQHLAEAGLTIEQQVRRENRRQAGDEVLVSNSIGSLRELAALDWRAYVEAMSLVEHALRQDPAGAYAQMDFATRDRYRHAIEELARSSAATELEVARKTVQIAAEAPAESSEPVHHVGYHLVDAGRPALERAISARPSSLLRLRSRAGRLRLLPYLGSIVALTLVFSAVLAAPLQLASPWGIAALFVLLAIATSQLAISLVNRAAAMLVAPQPLQRMDFANGMPPECRTLVVVPSMLTNAAAVEALVDGLEVRALANRDDQLFFALLTDFVDSDAEHRPEDDALLDAAARGIEALNLSHRSLAGADATSASDRFFLFHRPRSWNPVERIWMGRERKRGKLAELNRLLHALDDEAAAQAFSRIVGERQALRGVRYVITLDTDTELPHDAARELVGTMAHPLNRPRFAQPRRARAPVVRAGHAILQPRVGVSLPSANRSRFASLFAGDPGIDPYTRAVSDLYQDLFGRGSFIGKGIYEVESFERALAGVFPDNRILSHDLLEGCYARSGLVNDVVLYESQPWRYLDDVARRHRWIRGDWQIASWVLPRVPAPDGVDARNPLDALSRWKILDNLRRSLVAPAVVLVLLAGWALPGVSMWWTLAMLGVYFVPIIVELVLGLLRGGGETTPWLRHLRLVSADAWRQLKQALFLVACLPYEARVHLDAVVRAQWRTIVTRRKLLEWRPSEIVEDRARSGESASAAVDLQRSFVAMSFAPVLAVLAAAWLVTAHPAALWFAAPILAAWFCSPVAAWWLSLPLRKRMRPLAAEQLRFLRMLSRRTWAYFEDFVDIDNNWLPPDNYQEAPVERLAHRTSPTNIGFALTANLAAWDFGYLTSGGLLDRTANTLETMSSLERFQGHFCNWYDTRTLQPLRPIYVSSVDSGNLAASMLTLRPGLLALADAPILSPCAVDGLQDILQVLLDTQGATPRAAPVRRFGTQLARIAQMPLATLGAARSAFAELAGAADECVAAIAAANDEIEHAAAWSPDAAAAREAADAQRPHDSGNPHNPPAASAPAGGERRSSLDEDPEAQADAEVQVADEADESALHPHALQRNPAAETLRWARALSRQCHAALDELYSMAPAAAAQAKAPDAPFAGYGGDSNDGDDRRRIPTLREAAQAGSTAAAERLAQIDALVERIDSFVDLDYRFLYDPQRRLLSIGYNVDERRLDASYYDLLASEARLTSFVAIAQNRLPTEHWFALGRLLTRFSGEPVLVSWSGSMFEYLMPLLVMPGYENSLLDQTCKAAVARQIEYGRQRGVPWGISESGYNAVDAASNYQYRAFGVPGLGLKRGLSADVVVAPYATALALLVDAPAAVRNLQKLWNQGLAGALGLYEAVDYTAMRLPPGETETVVRSFMAHHQGMALLALVWLLREQPMQRRFTSDPNLRGTLLLLQERVPRVPSFHRHTTPSPESQLGFAPSEMPIRVISEPQGTAPQVQLLSNGRYHVMVTHAGGGYSRWNDLAITRWQEDPTRDHWGAFCYVRDVSSDAYWSTAWQPSLRRAEHYEAIFSEGRAEFRRRDTVSSNDPGVETHTEIVVSPEDDIELRRVTLTNRGRRRRTLELTTYAEIVLAPQAADAMHPAFGNLFVQTEILETPSAILSTRRPRSPDEQTPWMCHLMAVHAARSGPVSHETDRALFVGRGNGLTSPDAMRSSGPLSGSSGSVLDPIASSRCTITLEADESATVDLVTGIASSRDACAALAEKYVDRRLADRVFKLAWSHSQVVLRQLGASEIEAQLYARLASSVVYANPALRADASVLMRNRHGQADLWAYGISGDFPIVLVVVSENSHLALVRQMVQAHAYWRLKGLSVDLVIWNDEADVYRQQLQETILGLIPVAVEAHVIDRPGGIFVRYASQISREDRVLMQSIARAVVVGSRGGLAEQLSRRGPIERRVAPLVPGSRPVLDDALQHAGERPALLFYNGHGGFTRDAREYVVLDRDEPTPAPWANVIANPGFGTVVSESGSAYTWFENAHEFRLTPWHNDPLVDPSGETFYLRDEETGRFWSPVALPEDGASACVARHGFGYSVFERTASGIESTLTTYVALDAAMKFSVLRVRNRSGRPRKLSATAYVEWVLGDLRSKSAMHVATAVDAHSGALIARNRYSAEFGAYVAFLHTGESFQSSTCDRTEFIGRNGTLRRPAAMRQLRLSGRSGAGMDPCAAIQVPFELAEGQEREIVFRLGVARDADEGHRLIDRFRGSTGAREALAGVHRYWRNALDTVQVSTPEPALDVLANGWLPYQTLACRVWGRSGYYQSGGAFGFRDQLQDVMALVHMEPALMREHLLRCASRQFVEGDVQHWWHPPSGRGVRTQCSDDYLWLPLATSRYVHVTGDTGVLDERATFLEGRPVNPGEDSYYDLPTQSGADAPLYHHCVLAIRHGMRYGPHELPLIGTGDWNDGMNLVGDKGRGESVWLGFFLHEVLRRFAPIARDHGDEAFAQSCESEADALRERLAAHAWDGNWYRRAYFDDGTPLGSAQNEQCRIDSIAQSWSVLSGAGDPHRSASAMNALDEHLVRREARLVQLLDPPFDHPDPNPGYIAGYVPGVRENGGQYTHAAIWAAMAFAEQGDAQRAWELFRLICPVNHGTTPEQVAIYRAEPYVVAADVYAVAPHVGRGGWSWYTGSAGWMYRLIVESLLGLRIDGGERLRLEPVVPQDWSGFEMRYRHRETPYRIRVRIAEAGTQPTLRVDGVVAPDRTAILVDDRREHEITLDWPRAGLKTPDSVRTISTRQ